MVIAPMLADGTGDGRREANGLINHSSLYGKYEEGSTASPPMSVYSKACRPAPSSKIHLPPTVKRSSGRRYSRWMKRIFLFGSTGPRGSKRDGVVQSVAKSAARQVTNQIIRGMLGSLMGGKTLALYVAGWRPLSGLRRVGRISATPSSGRFTQHPIQAYQEEAGA